MSDAEKQPSGTIIGFDLTVPDAESIRDFYAAVVGWRSEPFDMGGYADYFMQAPESGQTVAGIVHARGENADMPPQWLTYVVVDDLDASLRQCEEGRGTIVMAVKGGEGGSRYCVIQDPAGAYLALLQTGR